jgi:hypothetical protein
VLTVKVQIILAVLVALFASLIGYRTNRRTSVGLAQQPPTWVTKRYCVLENGNELYADCQIAEKGIETAADGTMRVKVNGADLFSAGTCWGYIMAVVDSIPEGEGFAPDGQVSMTQHMDVVLAYLRDNPSQRHLPAYYLVRTALTNAFEA